MRKILVICLFCLGVCINGFAQSPNNSKQQNVSIIIPEVALIELFPTTGASTDITMNFTKPDNAGEKIKQPGANATTWLNFSSIVTATGADRVRKVTLKSNILTAGYSLAVQADDANVSATGFGTLGNASNLTLDMTDQDLITDIGSSYTGRGANKGYKIRFTTTTPNANYASIKAGTVQYQLTYTLSDH